MQHAGAGGWLRLLACMRGRPALCSWQPCNASAPGRARCCSTCNLVHDSPLAACFTCGDEDLIARLQHAAVAAHHKLHAPRHHRHQLVLLVHKVGPLLGGRDDRGNRRQGRGRAWGWGRQGGPPAAEGSQRCERQAPEPSAARCPRWAKPHQATQWPLPCPAGRRRGHSCSRGGASRAPHPPAAPAAGTCGAAHSRGARAWS